MLDIIEGSLQLQNDFRVADPDHFHQDSFLDLDVTEFAGGFGKVAKLDPQESVAWVMDSLAGRSEDYRGLLLRQIESWGSM